MRTADAALHKAGTVFRAPMKILIQDLSNVACTASLEQRTEWKSGMYLVAEASGASVYHDTHSALLQLHGSCCFLIIHLIYHLHQQHNQFMQC